MAARSAYERAAYGGNAAAAIGMGKTYDPLFLAQLGARGVHGDPLKAAYWYARARDAGDREGDRKLRALFSGIQKCVILQGTCPTPGRKG
jgi:TPR repeat protein